MSRSDMPRRQTARLIELAGAPHLQWTLQHDRQQTHENLAIDDSVRRLADLFGDAYRNAHLFTTDADVVARITKAGACQMTDSPPSRKVSPASLEHDRQKQYLIPEGTPCPFLIALGIMTPAGHVRQARQAKFRQINRYLEFVEDVYDDLPADGPLEVVDFGCGLSYLTFALHHLLSVIHGRDVRIRGIDQNPAVIDRCRRTADELRLEGLEFLRGEIATLAPTEPAGDDPSDGPATVHLAVSLHACDTATDDALAAAVRMGARVILAAPCCQHELFTQLDSEPLALLTRHGILKERFAALATDALRAAVLEQAGYRSQVIEFIDTEHTPKNLLLRAVRREQGTADPRLPERIAALKQLLGINQTRLESLLSTSQADGSAVERTSVQQRNCDS
jgi:SAM-dependent methyltransferase